MHHRDVSLHNFIWGSFEHETGASKTRQAALPQPGALALPPKPLQPLAWWPVIPPKANP